MRLEAAIGVSRLSMLAGGPGSGRRPGFGTAMPKSPAFRLTGIANKLSEKAADASRGLGTGASQANYRGHNAAENAHSTAAEAHNRAAEAHEQEGNTKMAAYHTAKAESHEDKAVSHFNSADRIGNNLSQSGRGRSGMGSKF
jgi:hypothetical protein